MIDQSHSPIHAAVEQFVREELSQENAHIAGAVWSMLDAGGKQLRPRITMLAGRAAAQSSPEDPVLASYMELIHVATLIHDDVLDNAGTRRGRQSTNRAYGNRFSVLAGDYLFSWVFKKITIGYAPPVPTILAAMLAEICNGEVKQLRAAGDLAMTPERYLEIIGKKTAELFGSCAEVGAINALLQAGKPSGPALRAETEVLALREFGRLFGLAFQIRDDLYDAIASEAQLGKPAGSDLREKKMTLPLIYALADGGAGARGRVERLFAYDDPSDECAQNALGAVVEMLRDRAVVERTTHAVQRYAGEALRALAPLPQSAARDELAGLARSLSAFSS
ncbi:MAG: polyprenyl synthetase family protein [Candidatus Eremiobacteraeota bacterium]|nr:polyprenyl synthetase family protein [Candidatus Eremiobacteraeota bacterium]